MLLFKSNFNSDFLFVQSGVILSKIVFLFNQSIHLDYWSKFQRIIQSRQQKSCTRYRYMTPKRFGSATWIMPLPVRGRNKICWRHYDVYFATQELATGCAIGERKIRGTAGETGKKEEANGGRAMRACGVRERRVGKRETRVSSAEETENTGPRVCRYQMHANWRYRPRLNIPIIRHGTLQ